MAAPWYNVFVGCETGLLKGINVQQGKWDNLNSVDEAGRENEICSMCWGNESHTELCIGLKNRKMYTFNREENSLTQSETECIGGTGKIRGLLKYEDQFLTAVESGLVKLWKDDKENLEINAGDGLSCISQNLSKPQMIGTGGKENDLKIWDLHCPEKPVFVAKNVRNDWLNLRVPIWVLGIGFLPKSDKIITCTGHHQVRVYDPTSSQRRPVLDMDFDEYPLTAMSVCQTRDNYILVGNTQGKMAQIDLRKGQMVHCFKGFAGSIRSIVCHDSLPLVASCGLDRHLRIHDINTKQLLNKVYLKSRLNCILMAKEWSLDDDDEEHTELSGMVKNSQTEAQLQEKSNDSSGEEEELWNKIEVVHTKTVKKKERLEAKINQLHHKGEKKRQKDESLIGSDISVPVAKKKRERKARDL